MPEQFLHGVEVVEVDDGLRPIRTAKSSIIGLVGTAADAPVEFLRNTPFLITGPRHAASLGNSGTLKDAYEAVYAQGVNVVVAIIVDDGADAAATIANVVGDATTGTGLWGFLSAQSMLGLTPRILAAPGFTSTLAVSPASPVTTGLISVAQRLRGIVVADGPNTNEADAIIDAAKWGSDRLYIVDPHVLAYDTATASTVTRPASAYVAGAFSKRDMEKGFWWSPSNQILNGVTGIARPIGFNISAPDTEANRLNEKNIATVVQQNGFRIWGNRSLATDPLWAFISVRRTADMIYESVEAAHLWAMDRPFSAQLLIDIRDSVQAYIQHLVNVGALLGGNVWLDPELNTETTLKAGKLYLDFDIEPPAPLEHLTFRAHRNGTYYEELVDAVLSA